MRLAVLGDPLAYTLSPVLHRAGLAALGIAGDSAALRTPIERLPDRLLELASAGCTGVNLTHPLKDAVLPLLARVSEDARVARSVNTVGWGEGGPWGETTDGAGFVDLLRALGREPARERVVLHGSGGASRSLARSLAAAGCIEVVVASRDPGRAAAAWRDLPAARLESSASAALAEAHRRATLVVNGTPLSTATDPVPAAEVAGEALFVDLTYGPEATPWVLAARATGRAAIDGVGLLVHQARRSLELWTGRRVPIEPLARAVGWAP